MAADVDPAILRQAIEEVTSKRLLRPHGELERAMKLFGFETVHSATALQLPFTGSVAGHIAVHTSPVLATATRCPCSSRFRAGH